MTPVDPRHVEWEQAARRAAAWTTGLLLLFIALVAATVAFAWVEVHRALEPQHVAEELETYITSHNAEWTAELRQELAKKAPAAVRRLVHQAEDALPRDRARVEQYLDSQVKTAFARAAALGEQDFRKFVMDNRDYLRQGFADLRQLPSRMPQFADGLEQRLDKQVGVNLRGEAAALLGLLDDIDARLERLARDKGLSPAEQVERRIVRTLRALQVEGAKDMARVK